MPRPPATPCVERRVCLTTPAFGHPLRASRFSSSLDRAKAFCSVLAHSSNLEEGERLPRPPATPSRRRGKRASSLFLFLRHGRLLPCGGTFPLPLEGVPAGRGRRVPCKQGYATPSRVPVGRGRRVPCKQGYAMPCPGAR